MKTQGYRKTQGDIMNSIKLSAVAILLTSTLAIAGGKLVVPPTTEIETIPEPIEPIVDASGPYLGLGYSCLHLDFDIPDLDARAMTAISVAAGYDFNKYFAVEGRYTASIGDIEAETILGTEDMDWDMSNIALYLKPKYTIDSFTVYGLLGFGEVTYDDGDTSYSEAGFQYGVGIGVMATDNIDVYVDYRRLYDDEEFDGLSENKDVTANSFTVGVNYHF